MATRPSRSASIPIPTSASPTARSLEDVFSMPFARPPSSGTTSRVRRTSNVSSSPERLRGPSVSPVRSTIGISPSRPLVGGYSSAVSRSISQRPTASDLATPTFQPRIIRAASNPVASRDPIACLPGTVPLAPVLSTSPVRPHRLGDHRSPTTPSAPRPSSLLPASTRAHSSVHSESPSNGGQGFPRPAYLEYSALREFLHTDAPAIIPPPRITAVVSHPLSPIAAPQPYPYLRRSLTPVDSESEETPSPSPPPQDAGKNGLGIWSANPVLRLPTRWSEQDRGTVLTISPDGREVTFCGPSCTGDKDSAAARTNFHIPPSCGIYYYEVEIVQRGQKGHISIGFSAGSVRLIRLPGWESFSWGYHADDGWSFAGSKDGTPYGPTFDSGDVIGCGIDYTQNRAFYTKNGAFLGMVFENIPTSNVPLFPSIGMRHNGEAVRANFGSAPFRFAIADHVRNQRDAVWEDIMRLPSRVVNTGKEHENEAEAKELKSRMESAAEEETRAALRKLMMDYLAHHGYARTAKAFRAQCAKDEGMGISPSTIVTVKRESADVAMDTDEGPQAGPSSAAFASHSDLPSIPAGTLSDDLDDLDPADAETRDLHTRLSILHAVRAGDIDAALDGLKAHYPQALTAQDGLLLFWLRCRKFVELVLKAGASLRKVKEAEKEQHDLLADGAPPPITAGEVKAHEAALDGEGAMDVDDPSPEALPTSAVHKLSDDSAIPVSLAPPAAPSLSDIARDALHTALAYGQALEADYKADTRHVVQAHRLRTFGLVAYEDPENAGGAVGALAGQEARVELAGEVNQAILQSQGRPVHPALETLVRQSGACVVQLGLLGVGRAAFADVGHEFLEA